jgi:hypothetical protein
MKKVYIITAGSYSDYGIECCFSTKAKAKEYLKLIKENLDNEDIRMWHYSDSRIEEYILDSNPKIVTVIRLWLDSPELQKILSPDITLENARLSEQIDTSVEKELYHKAIEDERIEIQRTDRLFICRIANPNKPLEEEIERVKKIAYDTIKKINYLVKLEGVNETNINKYI